MAEEMSDDLYSDGGDTAVAEETESETTTEETAAESDSKSSESGSPGLLPKGFFQGKDLKPGTICKIKVEKLTDGQALVSYVPHGTKDEDVEVEETSELDEMMS
jgi:hypothetical protein